MRLLIIFLALLTLLRAATLFGGIYDADSFSKLNNTIIKIEGQSMTTQLIVNSPYSVEIPEGRYDLTAAHYKEGKIDYIIKENVFVNSSQTKFDLVLIPYELYLLTPKANDNIANVSGNDIALTPSKNEKPFDYIQIVLAIVVILVVAYFAFSKKTETENRKTETDIQGSEPKTEDYLPDKEARELLKILRENEGRMYQKELREILNWSEAKMSVTITELEIAGVLKRIKKGRDNMLKLLKE